MPHSAFERAAAGLTIDGQPYSFFHVNHPKFQLVVDSNPDTIPSIDLVLSIRGFPSGTPLWEAIETIREEYKGDGRFQFVPDLTRQLGSIFELPLPPCDQGWAWLWHEIGKDDQLFSPWLGLPNDEQTRDRIRMEGIADRQQYALTRTVCTPPTDPITEKSYCLLRQHLTRTQRSSLKRRGFFYVYTPSGKRYRLLSKGRTGNVELCGERGEPVRRYCAHPDQHLPMGDVLLAQKLHLECDEDGFLKVANLQWSTVDSPARIRITTDNLVFYQDVARG